MKFSIITCTFNSEKYLQETIDSISKQTFRDFEVLFIDGDSIDDTHKIIRNSNLSYKLIENVNGGISKAMNIGALNANGEIIIHLHSDDYLENENVLFAVNETFEKHKSKKWLFGKCKRNINGETFENHFNISYSKKGIYKRNIIPHPATFIKKTFFEELGGFDESLKYAMDYDLWLRASEYSPIQLDTYLSVFREHEGSLSSSNKILAFEEDYKVRKKYIGNNIILQVESLLRHYKRFLCFKLNEYIAYISIKR